MDARVARFDLPSNEPVRRYAPGDADRVALEAELRRQSAEVLDVPCVVGGKQIFTGNVVEVHNPGDHGHLLARVHLADAAVANAAADAAMAARREWMALAWEERAAVFLKAAALLAGPRRAEINAATMLAQAKTVHQAEIDAVCELVDFWNFNVHFAGQIYAEQPPVSPSGTWNQLDHRPLDGFVFAVAPFNFTSIALNLPTAPALVGNTVVFKPTLQTSTPVWRLLKILEEAGLPPGVVNLVNGHGRDVGDPILHRSDLGGVHFTGSTGTFQSIWRTVGENIASYRQWPRLVGETGGKDFVLAHPSADPAALAVAILRGGYEYQGQKCSAASRVYVPRSLWGDVKARVVDGIGQFGLGDVRDLRNFVSAVIDERAFTKHRSYQDLARSTATVHAGGGADRSKGWYVEPTFVEVSDPKHRMMEEEIFGPVVTAFVYDDARWDDVLDLVDGTSPYALTGALFASDRRVIAHASQKLRFAAGNFYLNDKPTGAVVGQQPFGGGRGSGTNDKAGSPLNLVRWLSPRTIKETFVPPTDWRYPFLG
jgi:1-pyrroline-5-carboxylate dehydrogenase